MKTMMMMICSVALQRFSREQWRQQTSAKVVCSLQGDDGDDVLGQDNDDYYEEDGSNDDYIGYIQCYNNGAHTRILNEIF